jgi:hypothetical protein
VNELVPLRLRISPLPLLLHTHSQRLQILDKLSMRLELLRGSAIELLYIE